MCGYHLSAQNKGVTISWSFKDMVPIVFMKTELLPDESCPRACWRRVSVAPKVLMVIYSP